MKLHLQLTIYNRPIFIIKQHLHYLRQLSSTINLWIFKIKFQLKVQLIFQFKFFLFGSFSSLTKETKKLQSSAKLSWPKKSRRKGFGENKMKRERKERKMVKNWKQFVLAYITLQRRAKVYFSVNNLKSIEKWQRTKKWAT